MGLKILSAVSWRLANGTGRWVTIMENRMNTFGDLPATFIQSRNLCCCVSGTNGLPVLREVLRQGGRVLSFQDQVRESVLRRASELLKLSVATLGGVIVIGGIMSATRIPLPTEGFIAFAVGVGALVCSTGLLAATLADIRSPGAFTHGPDLRRIAQQMRRTGMTEVNLLIALVDAQPDWVEDNGHLIVRVQRMVAWALALLALGTIVLLAALFYIAGGAIFV